MLAIVRLIPFWELAVSLFAGVLIDSFIVRSYVVPGLISLFGEASWWPWQRPLIPYVPARRQRPVQSRSR